MQILTPDGYKDASTLTAGDQVCSFDSGGNPIINTILSIQSVNTDDYLQLHNYVPTPFQYVTINGTFSFFQDQSILANGKVVHATDIQVGDTIYSDANTNITVTSVETVDSLNYWWRLEVSGDSSYIADGVQVHNASRFWVLGTGTWDASTTTQWAASTGGGGGQSVPGASDTATFDGASGGGTVTLAYSPTVTSITMGVFTGTLASSTFNVIQGSMSNTGAGTRTLDMGSGVWTLTGNNTTLYNAAIAGGLTLVNKSDMQCTYSGSVGSRTVTTGNTSGGTEANSMGFNVTAGSDSFGMSGSALVGNLTFTSGFTGSLTNTARTVYGNFTVHSAMTVTAGANASTFAATSGTKTITTGGATLDFPITINGVGGTFVLGDNTIVGSGRIFTVTNGTFNANGKNFTTGIFSSSNTNVRTITMGSGQWTLTGNATTVWTCADLTNCTFTPGLPVNATYAGATGTRTISHGGTSASGNETNAVSFNIQAGTDTITFSTSDVVKAVDFTGFAGTLTSSSITLNGNLKFSSGMTCSAGAQVFTFSATLQNQTITTNSINIDRAVTVNNPGTVTFIDGWNGSTRTLTLTQGTLDDNGQTLNFGTISTSNSNVRTLKIAGVLNLAGNATTIWSTSVMTNFTLTQSGPINFIYSGSTGTRTITMATIGNGGTQANCPAITVTAGSDIITMTANRTVGSLTFGSGFTGTWTPVTQANWFGSLVLNSSMSITSAAVALTFIPTSGTFNITIGGNTGFGVGGTTITINAPGATYQWGSDFLSSSTLTLTAGTLNFNNFNTSSTTFNSNNSNTRTLTMGSGTYSLTGTGTIWATTTNTGLTFNAGTSTIKVTDSSATTKVLLPGITPAGLTFNRLWFSGGGTGIIQYGNSSTSTVNTMKIDAGLNINFLANSTLVVASATGWQVTGTSGHLITIASTSAGTQWNLSVASGIVSSNYLSLQDSNATGGATFYAGNHSVNVSNNTGWIFTNPPPNSTVATQKDDNGYPAIFGISCMDGVTPVKVQFIASGSSNFMKIDRTTVISVTPQEIKQTDANDMPVAKGVSSANGRTILPWYVNPSTGAVLTD